MKNILFDLGNVIIDLDFDRTISAFQKLGATNFSISLDLEKKVLLDYETGKISTQTFLNHWTNELPKTSESEIIEAWNALLLGIQPDTITLLKELRKQYNLIAFSNTNALHMTWVTAYFRKKYSIDNWQKTLFHNVYCSHEINTRKPESEGFELILRREGIDKEDVLFIDDHLPNVLAALKLGIPTIHKNINLSLRKSLETNIMHTQN